MNIGKAIRAARKAKGYTLQSLAEKSGVTFTNIGYWERGLSHPNIVSLIAVADALNISLDELVGRNVANIPTCKDCAYSRNYSGVLWCDVHQRATQDEARCERGRLQALK